MLARRSPGAPRGGAVVRDPDEEHRASTPLELLFDLCFVVGVAQAAAALHHELATDRVGHGLVGFAAGFFGVWWAWVNYTWFASAHDSDDVPHRLLTLVQMGGALVYAAGVAHAVETGGFGACVLGYVVMRLGLVAGWLRVGRAQPAVRARALRYAGAVTAVQVLWVVALALPGDAFLVGFLVLGLAELAVPVWAERAGDRPVFHAEHIEERYGLFTIIVLGESILAATLGIQAAGSERGVSAALVALAVSALVLAFGCWWLYFDHPGHLSPTPRQAFRWGYAHVVVFASLAALGAGVHVAAEAASGHGPGRVAALAVTLPVAGFLLGLALVMVLIGIAPSERRVWPKLAGAVVLVALGLAAPVVGAALGAAAVVAALATSMVLTGARAPG